MEHSNNNFSIFHFNDVYDIQPDAKQPKGGAAYFKSLLDRCRSNKAHPLTLFSGDAFSPALLSTEFEGENMIKPMNSLNIDLACFGNHEFDFSYEHVKELISKTNFEWLLSNVYDKRTQRRLAQALQFKIITISNIKIGFFSLAEKQWIDTLYPFYKQFCEYVDFLQFAEYMVNQLLETHKCDMIIALTHMMKYNDIKLAETVKGIDLILGGHDHLIVHEKVKNTVLVKSGTNFKNFSIIDVQRISSEVQIKSDGNCKEKIVLQNSKFHFEIQLKEVNHQKEKIEPNLELGGYITEIYAQFAVMQEKVACYTKKKIDLTFKTIRRQQTPFLEFIASVYRNFTAAECAFMNGGNFRMDCEFKEGPITFGPITKIVLDQVVVKKVPGKNIVEALQNSVSMYPNMSGRYCALSGLQFTWDCTKEPNNRVQQQTVRINGEKIDLKRQYKVAMHSFVGLAGDGFDSFKSCPMDEQSSEIDNMHILYELLNLNEDLLNSYESKYPGKIKVIEKQVDGETHRYIELDLPEPKNVRMIGSVPN